MLTKLSLDPLVDQEFKGRHLAERVLNSEVSYVRYLIGWIIVGAKAERAVMTKPPSRRVWPTARAPPEVMLSLTTRRAIKPYRDDTVELSMKAPMSVSKPADLG